MSAGDSDALLVVDLLNTFDRLGRMLEDQLARAAWLDAYLLAAGMNQVAEDYLQREISALQVMLAKLEGAGGRAGRAARLAVRRSRTVAMRARSRRRSERLLAEWQRAFALFVQQLASQVVAPSGAGYASSSDNLLARARALPAGLRRAILKLPTCFRSLDQRVEDCGQLVDLFSARWPDRARPVLVLGIRTSGSYLAPLVVAYLHRAGYARAAAMTWRPGREMPERDRQTIMAHARRGGLVLLADDPPSTGTALAAAARALEVMGVPHQSLVLLLALIGTAQSVPAQLSRYHSVLLPHEAWTVHRWLDPAEVRSALEELLPSAVTAVERVDWTPPEDLKAGSPDRHHIRALFQVTTTDAGGKPSQLHVYVKGVGLGYFGRHALAVAKPLASLLPETYGVRNGLLFRAWLPDTCRVSLADRDAAARQIAEYAAARRRLLGVEEDPTPKLGADHALWERASYALLSAAFRYPRLTVVGPPTYRAARWLLRTRSPAVIDGSMALSQWFGPPGNGQRLKKVDYDERAFANQDNVGDQLYCYDTAYDVASAAADAEMVWACADAARFSRCLRQAYEELTGEPISEEHWLLYQLLWLRNHLQQLESALSRPASDLHMPPREHIVQQLESGRRAQARAHQRYFERRICHDLTPPGAGGLCGIDLDGVLETTWLGFMAITPLGARSLRALVLHGYRPVLVTGRSVGDVQERCRAYHLAGGVAEYGAALCVDDSVQLLLPPDAVAALDQLRDALGRLEGVYLDPAYQFAVRAYRFDEHGLRRGLPERMAIEVLTATRLACGVQVIPGNAQTDFMVQGIDKGTGLRALMGRLQAPLAMAIGDTRSDLPMLRLAERPFSPSNADAAVRQAGIPLTNEPYQAGLAEAVERLLGHAPGRCRACRQPPLPFDTNMLVTILSAQNTGKLGNLKQAWLLLRQLGLASRP